MFDPRLQAKILNVVDVSYGGENGFNQAIELSSEILLNVKFIHEKSLMGKGVLENTTSGEIVLKLLNKEQDSVQSNFRDPETSAELEVQEKMCRNVRQNPAPDVRALALLSAAPLLLLHKFQKFLIKNFSDECYARENPQFRRKMANLVRRKENWATFLLVSGDNPSNPPCDLVMIQVPEGVNGGCAQCGSLAFVL
ncbi:hypothetical protein RHSIM_Rhsim07G0199900 [Rhododendron simsii]|uniref:Uncharacterized protein n=1 Tax=Rhododendron simsii TaxID=118357 RepID=A0A834LJG7_RHOSS|nr:hypothetical protein RHSIM_Rhsim07G0199900 [Rhododendron simsii]